VAVTHEEASERRLKASRLADFVAPHEASRLADLVALLEASVLADGASLYEASRLADRVALLEASVLADRVCPRPLCPPPPFFPLPTQVVLRVSNAYLFNSSSPPCLKHGT
jgi:hypothetical protein